MHFENEFYNNKDFDYNDIMDFGIGIKQLNEKMTPRN